MGAAIEGLSGQKPRREMRGKERWENERVVKMMKRNGGGGVGIRGKRERSKEIESVPGLQGCG